MPATASTASTLGEQKVEQLLSKIATSEAPGTTPPCQFVAVFQLGLVVPFQVKAEGALGTQLLTDDLRIRGAVHACA